MTSIILRFWELIRRILFLTYFIHKGTLHVTPKIYPSIYDNLGKSFSKYESHPRIFATSIDPIFWRLGAKIYPIRNLTLRSFKVKSSSMAEFAIYEFLLVSNSNYMSISHQLGDICTRKFSLHMISYHWAKILAPLRPTFPHGDFSQN